MMAPEGSGKKITLNAGTGPHGIVMEIVVLDLLVHMNVRFLM